MAQEDKQKIPKDVSDAIERVMQFGIGVPEKKLLQLEHQNAVGKRDKVKKQYRVTKPWHIAFLKDFAIDGKPLSECSKKYHQSEGYLRNLWKSESALTVIRQLIERTDIKLARARVKMLNDECIDVLVSILRSTDPFDKPLKKSIALELLKGSGVLAESQELKITKEYIFREMAKATEDGYKEAQRVTSEEVPEAELEEQSSE